MNKRREFWDWPAPRRRPRIESYLPPEPEPPRVMIEVRHRRNNLPQLIIAVAVIFALVVLRRSPGGLLVVAGLLGPSAIPALMIFVAVVAAASIYAKLRGRPF